MRLWLYGYVDGRRDGQLDRGLHVQFVSGEAVGQELGAAVVLVWYFGLKGLVQFPPHWAHTGPKTTFLFEFVTLRKNQDNRQAGHSALDTRSTLDFERNRPSIRQFLSSFFESRKKDSKKLSFFESDRSDSKIVLPFSAIKHNCSSVIFKHKKAFNNTPPTSTALRKST